MRRFEVAIAAWWVSQCSYASMLFLGAQPRDMTALDSHKAQPVDLEEINILVAHERGRRGMSLMIKL